MMFTGHGVKVHALCSMRMRFRLEIKGVKFKGRSMYAIVKDQYGLKGNRISVYDQFHDLVESEILKLQTGDIVGLAELPE